MFFGDKAPRFGRIEPPQELHSDTIHLRGMSKRSLLLPPLFKGNRSRMQTIMARLAERQEIALLIAASLAAKHEMMDL